MICGMKTRLQIFDGRTSLPYIVMAMAILGKICFDQFGTEET